MSIMKLSGTAGALLFSMPDPRPVPELSHIPHWHPCVTGLALEASGSVASALLLSFSFTDVSVSRSAGPLGDNLGKSVFVFERIFCFTFFFFLNKSPQA